MNNRNKNILLGVLIVGVVSMTVAFAALSTRLNITGQASVAATTWNIHFQNWDLDTDKTVTYDNNEHQNTAVYPTVAQLSQTLAPNVTKVDNLNVTLKQPGDYARYTFEIINEGSIDASLADFSAPMTCASGNDCSHVSYNVKCYDNENLTGSEITTNDVLTKNGGLVYCYLEAKYLDQTNNNTAGSNQVYTQSQASATLSASWQWVQNVNEDSNSGSGNSGNEPVTPSNPYQTSFSGTYGYDFAGALTIGNGGDSEWVSTLDPDVTVYMRNDGTKNEVCGVFGSGQAGTVCIAPNADGYYDDFTTCSESGTGEFTSSDIDDSCLTGYSKAKAEEMLDKGASSCDVYDYSVRCSMTSGAYCDIGNNGYVGCYGGSGDWYLSSDGRTSGGGH